MRKIIRLAFVSGAVATVASVLAIAVRAEPTNPGQAGGHVAWTDTATAERGASDTVG